MKKKTRSDINKDNAFKGWITRRNNPLFTINELNRRKKVSLAQKARWDNYRKEKALIINNIT